MNPFCFSSDSSVFLGFVSVGPNTAPTASPSVTSSSSEKRHTQHKDDRSAPLPPPLPRLSPLHFHRRVLFGDAFSAPLCNARSSHVSSVSTDRLPALSSPPIPLPLSFSRIQPATGKPHAGTHYFLTRSLCFSETNGK